MEQVLAVSTCLYHIVVFLPSEAPSFTCYFLNPLLLTSGLWICPLPPLLISLNSPRS